MTTRSENKLRPLIECAIMVALACVLSFIKIYKLPLGGAVTLLSMLPICVVSIRLGLGWGMAASFTYSVFQLLFSIAEVLTWGLTPISLVGCIIFDYLLAFSLLGLAGSFCSLGGISRGKMLAGITLALVLRFCSHLVSGTVIFDIWLPEGWANPFVYSVVYNGSFMLPELILTLIAAMLLTKTPAFTRLLAKK